MHRCWPVLIVMASAWPVWADDSSPGVKRALLVCGHPGDDDHAKLFGETFAKIHHGLTETLGFPEEYISAFFGVKPGDAALPGVAVQSPGSREAIAKAIAQLRNELRPQDTLWVIVMGHAHFDGRHAFLNLPGPDMHQDDFGGLFRDLACREQVFLITTPASGYFIKPLSAPGRIVITATEADLEVNETLFPHALADEVNPTAEKPLNDADQDGLLTIFDFYIAVTKNVAQRYIREELIATEHALLDDNGDGRGSELQLDYLTEEEGGRRRRNFQPSHKAGADGSLAVTIRFPKEPRTK